MKTILVPVDFSDVARSVVETAVMMARTLGGQLVLLHVAPPEPEFIGYDPGPQTVRISVAQELKEEHRRIRELEEPLKAEGLDVKALVIQGYPVEKILDEITKHEADLVVMGSHGHGALHNLLVGSVTEGVLRKTRVPVVVVPADRPA